MEIVYRENSEMYNSVCHFEVLRLVGLKHDINEDSVTLVWSYLGTNVDGE